ncbi:MAG TPA: FAD-linked oxidase C-terminal domain-containing protein [Xanthomonadales bacterium]|nr:FAD-linked oxidase C-terminal domain-containing protein [Xanthomonadales bacterium]
MPREAWLTDAASCAVYGYDNSRRHGPVIAVALPADEAQVQSLVRACATSRTPIVARGRGTATTGATVPIAPSVVVCFERMQRIVRIEAGNRFAVVEPGVINGDLQLALQAHGFFWPPDPTSAPYSTVGGNLACNAGGPRTVKYGACRENVLGLRFVCGSGEIVACGSFTTKGAVGYDLSRLLIGSEGTLGLITSATLKLTPLPQSRAVLRALYDSIDAAAQAVARLMAQPATPSALEFMDARAIELVRTRAGLDLPADAQAMLLIEADGSALALAETVAAIAAAAGGSGCLDVRQASSAADSSELWAARKALSPILRSLAPKKINEDVVVPVTRLPQLVRGLQTLSTRHDTLIVTFGHAGNGNLHVNLLYDPAAGNADARARVCLSEVFDLVIALDGTLSGEHGIGIDKRDFLPRAMPTETLALMRAIKAQFDPFGIFNPGKVLPAL